jgi:RNA polymerase sigma-70 factor (ECF subfamily)
MLRSRRSRREEPLEARLPEPIVTHGPEEEALLADGIGLALLVVLETLTPAERLAFVLHDLFGVPFEAIAPIVDRSPAAARKLASRARRRVRGATPEPDADLARQREIVDAFLAAAREGDFGALLSVLDPEVVLRVDRDGAMQVIRGANAVIAQASTYAPLVRLARPVLVNGAPGFVVASPERPFAVAGFTIAGDRIVEIDVLADPDRLSALKLGV